jgi:hypothetical protein
MVIKSVIVTIAAICILAGSVLRYKNPIEEGFLPHPKTIQTVLCYHNLMFVDE